LAPVELLTTGVPQPPFVIVGRQHADVVSICGNLDEGCPRELARQPGGLMQDLTISAAWGRNDTMSHSHIPNPHLNMPLLRIVGANAFRYAPYVDQICRIAPIAFAEIDTTDPAGSEKPGWRQGYFTWLDALCLCAVLCHRNPKTYLEIGSGNSTRFARWCIGKFGLRTRIISIDPHPRLETKAIADEIHAIPVQEAPLSLFNALGETDVLFYDGSHELQMNSDLVLVAYHILPELDPHVMFGTHDTYVPLVTYNTEDYVLGALLLGGSNYAIDLPAHYLASINPETRKTLLSLLESDTGRKVAATHSEFYAAHGGYISGDMQGCSFYISRT
jgi:hypothetical protein